MCNDIRLRLTGAITRTSVDRMSASGPRRTGFLAHVWQMASGTALGQVCLIAATPFLSRLYTPSDFGIFGIFTAFVAVVSVAATLRLEMALPSARDDHEESDLILTILLVSVPVSLVLGALLWPLARLSLLGLGSLPIWAGWLASLAVLAVGLVNSVRFLQTRRRRFDIVGRALAIQGLVRGLLPLLLAAANLGWIGLTLGDTLGRIFGIRPMLANAGAQLSTRLRTFSFRDAGRVLKQHKNFLQILLPSSLVNAAATALPLPIIARLFRPGSGRRICIDQPYSRRTSRIDRKLGCRRLPWSFHAVAAQPWMVTAMSELKRTARKLLVVSIIIYVPAAILAPTLFPIVFGQQWQRVGWVLAVLTPFLTVGLVVSPLSRVLIVTDRMHFKLWFDGLFLVVPCSHCG